MTTTIFCLIVGYHLGDMHCYNILLRVYFLPTIVSMQIEDYDMIYLVENDNVGKKL